MYQDPFSNLEPTDQNVKSSIFKNSIKEACERIINDEIIDAMKQDETSRDFIGERITEIITEVINQANSLEIEKMASEINVQKHENSNIKHLLKSQENDFNDTITSERDKIHSISQKEKKLKQDNNRQKDDLANSTLKIDELKNNHEENVKNRLEHMINLREKENDDYSNLQEQLYHFKKEIEANKNQLTGLMKEKDDLEQTNGDLMQRLNDFEQERQIYDERLYTYESKLNSLEQTYSNDQEFKAKIDGELKDVSHSNELQRKKIEGLMEEKIDTERNTTEKISLMEAEFHKYNEDREDNVNKKDQHLREVNNTIKHQQQIKDEMEIQKSDLEQRILNNEQDYRREMSSLQKQSYESEQQLKSSHEEIISDLLREHRTNLEEIQKRHEDNFRNRIMEMREESENDLKGLLATESEIRSDLEQKIQRNYESTLPIDVHKNILYEKDEMIERLNQEQQKLTENTEQLIFDKSQAFCSTESMNESYKFCKRCENSQNQDNSKIFKLEESVREKSVELSLLKQQMGTFKSEISGNERQLSYNKNTYDKLLREYQEISYQEKNLSSENDQLKSLGKKSETECYSLYQEIKNLKISNMTLSEEKSIFGEKVNAQEITKNSIIKDNESLKRHVQDYTEVITQLRSNNAKNFEDYYDSKEKLCSFTEEVKICKMKELNMTDEISRMKENISNQLNKYQDLTKVHEELKYKTEEMTNLNKSISGEQEISRIKIYSLESDIDSRNKEIVELQQKLYESQNNYSTSDKNCEILKIGILKLKEAFSKNFKNLQTEISEFKKMFCQNLNDYIKIFMNEIKHKIKENVLVYKESFEKFYLENQKCLKNENEMTCMLVENRFKEIINSKEDKLFDFEERLKKLLEEKSHLMKENASLQEDVKLEKEKYDEFESLGKEFIEYKNNSEDRITELTKAINELEGYIHEQKDFYEQQCREKDQVTNVKIQKINEIYNSQISEFTEMLDQIEKQKDTIEWERNQQETLNLKKMKTAYSENIRKVERIKNNEIAELKLILEEKDNKIDKLQKFCKIYEDRIQMSKHSISSDLAIEEPVLTNNSFIRAREGSFDKFSFCNNSMPTSNKKFDKKVEVQQNRDKQIKHLNDNLEKFKMHFSINSNPGKYNSVNNDKHKNVPLFNTVGNASPNPKDKSFNSHMQKSSNTKKEYQMNNDQFMDSVIKLKNLSKRLDKKDLPKL